MARRGFSSPLYSYVVKFLLGAVALALVVASVMKLRNIQRFKGEISELESRLSQGQEIWKRYPPLSASARSDLERAQARLFRVLPKDRDVPSLLQEVARLARDHRLADISFHTADGLATPGAATRSAASQTAGSGPGQSPAPATAQGSKPIEAVPAKVAFAGDYRDIAFFLEGLSKIPRLVTVQSLKVQRGFPLLSAEVILQAYYQKGEMPVTVEK